MPLRRIGVAIAGIVALFALGRISSVVVDWAWFSSIGYAGVFWTALATKAALFVVVFAVSTLLLWANATLALRFASTPRLRLPAVFSPSFATFQASPGPWSGLQPSPRVWRLLWRLLVLAVAIILGLLIAWGETGRWDLILRFIYQAPYGRNDPLFDKDIGFYLFSLPVYVAVKNLALWILLMATLMAGSIYFLHDDISLDTRPRRVSSAAIAHGSALLGLFFAIKAWAYALDRYLLLYNDNGVVVGAGYADVHVELPALWLLIGLAAVAAVGAFANVRLRALRLVVAATLLVFGCSLLFAEAVPALIERFYVKPNELQLETPYIQRNIALNSRSVQPRPDHSEAIPRGTGSHLSVAQGRQRDCREHPAMGLATAAGHLCATAGDPHLLPVPRRRRRSLPSRRLLSAGHALAARALPFAAVAQRPNLGQPASPVHPWRRGGDVPGHPEVRRGLADLLPEGHPAGGDRRSADNRAAHLLRRKRRRLRDRQRSPRPSSTIPREKTTPIRVTMARTASRSAGSPGGPCSPGLSAT